MNLIKYILAATLFFASVTHADEKNTETLTEAIEIDHFIVNWNPNSDGLGRVIAYRCSDCLPVTMTFDSTTELTINEQIHPISELATKVDWSGVISVTNHAPTKIIRIRIY
jgi:hypothetical protein